MKYRFYVLLKLKLIFRKLFSTDFKKSTGYEDFSLFCAFQLSINRFRVKLKEQSNKINFLFSQIKQKKKGKFQERNNTIKSECRCYTYLDR